MDGRGGDGAAFLSPVSSLRRAEAEQRRAQQERVRAVPLSRSRSPLLSRTKRKQAEELCAEDRAAAAALKRQRQSPPAREREREARRKWEKTPRYLGYERGGGGVAEKTTAADRRTPRELTFPLVGDGESGGESAVDGGGSDGERWIEGLGHGSETPSEQEERALALFARYKVGDGVEPRRGWAND